MQKIGKANVALSSAAMCYSFWIICFLLPSYYLEYDGDEKKRPWFLDRAFITAIVIVTAGICGAGASVLWTAQGKYISECACKENKGFFNGYFWAIFSSSFVIGNLIGAIVLQNGCKKSSLFLIFAALAVIGSLLMCCLKKPQIQQPSGDVAVNEVSAAPDKIDGEVNEHDELSNVDNEEKRPCESIKDTFKLLINKRMLGLVPLMIWSGLSMAVYAGIFIPLMIRTMSTTLSPLSQNQQSAKALYTFSLLGVGEIIGGALFIGPIRDRFGNKTAYSIQSLLTILALSLVLIYSHLNTFSFLAYLMCFFWGIQDSGLNTLIYCVLGFEFEDKSTPFAVFKFT